MKPSASSAMDVESQLRSEEECGKDTNTCVNCNYGLVMC